MINTSQPKLQYYQPYVNGNDAYNETLMKLWRTLEAAGVIFIDGNGEGPGVRLKKKKS